MMPSRPRTAHLPTVNRRQLMTGAAATTLLAASASPAIAAPRPDRRIDFETQGIQASLDALITAGGIGAVASVVGESGTFTTAAGRRQLRGGVAVPQDRARIASVTKGMVATMVMQQIESGAWSLDTTIDEVAPGLHPGRGEVTLSQLMNHTSGMPDYVVPLLGLEFFLDPTAQRLVEAISQDYDETELLQMSASQEWLFAPGTSFMYSNAGYVTLSVLLQEATDARIEDLIRDRVFRPAGMHQSRLEESSIVRGRHLVPYAEFDGELTALDEMNPSVFSGAGGVYATAEDITDFTWALMTGVLLPQELVDVMVTPVGAAATLGFGYGLLQLPGPLVDASGQREILIGHDGAGFGDFALSVTTRDGSRRMSMGVTGRTWAPVPTLPNSLQVLDAAFIATCPEDMTVAPIELPTAQPGTQEAGSLQL